MVKVYDIPQAGRTSRGRAIVNLIGCNPEDRVGLVSVKEFDDDHYIVMATRNGVIKKTVLSAMENQERVEYMQLKLERVTN